MKRDKLNKKINTQMHPEWAEEEIKYHYDFREHSLDANAIDDYESFGEVEVMDYHGNVVGVINEPRKRRNKNKTK